PSKKDVARPHDCAIFVIEASRLLAASIARAAGGRVSIWGIGLPVGCASSLGMVRTAGMVASTDGLTLARDGHERRPELEPGDPVNTRVDPATLDPPRDS